MARAGGRLAWLGMGLAALLASSPALAQSGMDKDSDGAFTGIAIVTDDLKWFKLFESPKTPQISGQDVFRPNDRGALALIFSNAEAKRGVVRIECDVTAFDAKGSNRIVDGAACYEGPAYPDNVLVPALLDIQFEIEDTDPAGPAGFKVVMRDMHSGREVQLKVGFDQDTAR